MARGLTGASRPRTRVLARRPPSEGGRDPDHPSDGGYSRDENPRLAGKKDESLDRGIIPRTCGVPRTRDRPIRPVVLQRVGGEGKPAAPVGSRTPTGRRGHSASLTGG